MCLTKRGLGLLVVSRHLGLQHLLLLRRHGVKMLDKLLSRVISEGRVSMRRIHIEAHAVHHAMLLLLRLEHMLGVHRLLLLMTIHEVSRIDGGTLLHHEGIKATPSSSIGKLVPIRVSTASLTEGSEERGIDGRRLLLLLLRLRVLLLYRETVHDDAW